MAPPPPPKTREEIHAARAALKSQYGPLYPRLAALLFTHDPIGINLETNTDEYEPEVDTILPRLGACASADDVRRVIHEELVRWFDAKTAGPEERLDALARDVWGAWGEGRGAGK